MEKDIFAVHVAFTEYSPVTGNVHLYFTYRFIHDFFIVSSSLVQYIYSQRLHGVLIYTVIYCKGGKLKIFLFPCQGV